MLFIQGIATGGLFVFLLSYLHARIRVARLGDGIRDELIHQALRSHHRAIRKATIILEAKLTQRRREFFRRHGEQQVEAELQRVVSQIVERWQQTVKADYQSKSELLEAVWRDRKLTIDERIELLEFFRRCLLKHRRKSA